MTFPKIQSVNFFTDFPIFFDGSFQILMIGKGLERREIYNIFLILITAENHFEDSFEFVAINLQILKTL